MKTKRIRHDSMMQSIAQNLSGWDSIFLFHTRLFIRPRDCELKTTPRTRDAFFDLPVKFLLAFLRAFLWSNPSIYVKREPLSRSLPSQICSEAIDYVVILGLFIGRCKRRKENTRKNILTETCLHYYTLLFIHFTRHRCLSGSSRKLKKIKRKCDVRFARKQI